MDIRQDSRKHGYAWDAIIDKLKSKNKKLKDFEDLSEKEKIETLLSLKFNPKTLKFDDDFVHELIESIDVISTIQMQNGEAGCHRYVISTASQRWM